MGSQSDEKHVEWNYRDHSGPWDYPSGKMGDGKTKTGAFIHPKGGYYAADLKAIAACYEVGLSFTQKDMEKLVQTNLEFMWMGDEKNPAFKQISGRYKKAGKYGKGHLWTALHRFDPRIRKLWKTQVEMARASKRWMWHAGALSYLAAMSEAPGWKPL